MGPSLPLHPAVIHYPIAASFFAAGALLLGLVNPRARSASLAAAALLLGVAVLGGVAGSVTGWLWADQLAYLAGGWGPIPGPKAVQGLARRHALLAAGFVVAAIFALALVMVSRRRGGPRHLTLLALVAAILACGLAGATGHVGGTMVHAPPAQPDEAAGDGRQYRPDPPATPPPSNRSHP